MDLKLYEAEVIDIDDSTKKRGIKIKIHPEQKDIKNSDLPWAFPFSSINSTELENDLPTVSSIVYVLVDRYWKRFYYLGNKFFYDLFDFADVTSALNNASEISNKEYKNIKFRLYEDGGLEFHNKSDGSHGFIHKSGKYFIFDKDGKVFCETNELYIGGNKLVPSSTSLTINGNLEILK